MKEYTKEELEHYVPQLFKENPQVEAFYADKDGNFRTAQQLEAVANKKDFEFEFINPDFIEATSHGEELAATESKPKKGKK